MACLQIVGQGMLRFFLLRGAESKESIRSDSKVKKGKPSSSSSYSNTPMEEQLINPLAITHFLQHTLRSLCHHDNPTPWLYAVFWRILPRNYPPPKWDLQGGAYDRRSRANKRNWNLVWEDGFCNIPASISGKAMIDDASGSSGFQPELFFRMSHEIYNYGEGLIGKVAADHSHKWVYNDPQDQEITPLSQPRSWEAQFQSGIKTIALIAVGEGVLQLGAMTKVAEDLRYVVLLRNKFIYLESIPGVLVPHPSPSSFPLPESWPPASAMTSMHPLMQCYSDHFSNRPTVTPSMSSLEALLSKLPSVVAAPSAGYCMMPIAASSDWSLGMVAKEEEMEQEELGGCDESTSSIDAYYVNAEGI